jgi:ATP-binding cassette subfamily C protein CydC
MGDLRPWLNLTFRRPGRLITGGLLLFATLISGIALLAVSGWFITEAALVGLLLAAGTAATINLYVPGGLIRFFALSRTVFRYLERVYNHDTVLRLLTDIRVTLFRNLSRATRNHRNELSGAQWLSRLTSDVDALDTLYLRLIAPTATAFAVTLLVILLTALLLDGLTALLIALILALVLIIATLGVFLGTKRLAARHSEEQEALRTGVIEHIEGFAELTAAGRIGKHTALLMRQARRLTANQAKVDSRIGWHLACAQLLVNLSAVFALWAGFALFQTGAVSAPVLVLIPVALLGLAEVYGALPDAFGRLGATIGSAGRLNRDCHADQTAGDSTSLELPFNTALLCKNLMVKHAGYAPLFNHFELEVKAGERVGILGYSGSGKSSLADTFAGLLPARGKLMCQQPIYLTQNTVLFEDTLKANLLLGNPDATDIELWGILEVMDLAERFACEPDQLDTWLGSGGNRLSGGEARRVALARVLLSPAPLVVLDEPFTGLDSTTRTRITARMEDILRGKSVISLAHGPDALPGTDRVIHLND